MSRYLDFNLEPPDPPELPEAVARCCVCLGDIYSGEDCGVGPDGFICPDCIEDAWRGLSMTEKIERLGMEATKIERIGKHGNRGICAG